MNILITGFSGFLGKELIAIFNKNKFNKTLLGKKKNKKKNYFFCNLGNLKKLNFILKKLNPYAVINLAAEINFIKKTKNMYKVNAYCPHIIAKFCKRNKAHFIHVSTVVVNGIKKVYSKRTDFNPENHYGKSKLRGDILIKRTNCKYTILRFGGIYGKNGPIHLGINKFINLALKGKKIIFNGNKKSLRNYIFVRDAAKVILHCLQHKKYGIFYVGGETLSFESMLKKITKILTKKDNTLWLNNKKKLDNQIIKGDKILKYTSFAKSLKMIK